MYCIFICNRISHISFLASRLSAFRFPWYNRSVRDSDKISSVGMPWSWTVPAAVLQPCKVSFYISWVVSLSTLLPEWLTSVVGFRLARKCFLALKGAHFLYRFPICFMSACGLIVIGRHDLLLRHRVCPPSQFDNSLRTESCSPYPVSPFCAGAYIICV